MSCKKKQLALSFGVNIRILSPKECINCKLFFLTFCLNKQNVKTCFMFIMLHSENECTFQNAKILS